MEYASALRMGMAKWVYNLLNAFGFSIWGLTVIDLFALFVGGTSEFISGVDTWIKLIMALAGGVYFIIRGLIELPHKYKMQKLDYEKKKHEMENAKKGTEKIDAP